MSIVLLIFGISNPPLPFLVPFQKKPVTSRASSAVDKDLRVAYRDRFIGQTDARPSTTHAFRVLMFFNSSTEFFTLLLFGVILFFWVFNFLGIALLLQGPFMIVNTRDKHNLKTNLLSCSIKECLFK